MRNEIVGKDHAVEVMGCLGIVGGAKLKRRIFHLVNWFERDRIARCFGELFPPIFIFIVGFVVVAVIGGGGGFLLVGGEFGVLRGGKLGTVKLARGILLYYEKIASVEHVVVAVFH